MSTSIRRRSLARQTVQADHEGEPASLLAPEVPAARAKNGLNYEDLFDYGKPVVVQIRVTGAVIEGDTLELFRDNLSLGSRPIVQPDDFFFINVSPEDIPDGIVHFHYHVYGSFTGGEAVSHPMEVIVKTTVPGGTDTDPSTPSVNENLLPPTGFGPVVGPGAVTVTIAPYENMAKDDKIRLSWAGEMIPYTVLAEDVERPVMIIVAADIVAKHPGVDIVVRYEVRDIVNNWSRWSPSASADVTDPDALPAPRVDGVANNQLDLAVVGSNPVVVRIPTAALVSGDRIVVVWRAQLPQGPVAEYLSAEYRLCDEEIGFGITIEVPNATVIGQAGASVTVSYRVTSALRPPRGSLTTSFLVIGEVKGLEPPRVEHAVGDVLDPGTVPAGGTTVYVPHYPFMEEFDWITLTWEGITAASIPYFHYEEYEVSADDARSDLPFALAKEHITLLLGGSVRVSYSIEPGSQPGTVINSPSLALAIRDGASGTLLIPPVVVGAQDDVLNAATSSDPVMIKVGQYQGKAAKDKVTLHWEGSVASREMVKTVSDRYVNRDLDYLMGKTDYVLPNLNTTVNVWYDVLFANGRSANSTRVALRILGAAGDTWPAPVVLQANAANVLNPASAVNGATVRVAFSPMYATDIIGVQWMGSPGMGTPVIDSKDGNPTGVVDFPIPASAVAANMGRTLTVSYAVVRGDNQYESVELSLSITAMPQSELGAPAVAQANPSQTELDLNSFTGDATVTRAPWLLVSAGQRIWLTIEGTSNTTGAEPLSVPLGTQGRVISAAEVTQGLAVTLPRAQLMRFKPGTAVTIRLLVSFDGSPVQSQATAFVLRTLMLKAGTTVIAQRLTINEAPGDYLNFADIYQASSITARIPQYTGMAAGQTVMVRWQHDSIVWRSAVIPVTRMAPIDVAIPRMEVVDIIGRQAEIEYTVYQGEQQLDRSDPMTLRVSANPVDLPAPRISGDSGTATIPTNNLSAGQTVRLRWGGVVEHFGAEINVVAKGTPVSVPIPAQWVTESRGTTVLLNYSVLRRVTGESLLFSRVWRFTIA
jgi:hypothetical protein